MMRIPFSVRLISSVVIVQILMLGLMLWNSVRLINVNYMDLLQTASQEQSSLLAAAISPGMVAYDHAMIEDVLSLIKEKHDLVYAEVYDHNEKKIISLGQYDGASIAVTSIDSVVENDVYDITRNIIVSGQYLGKLRVVYSALSLKKMTDEVRWQNTFLALLTLLLTIIVTVVISILLTSRLRNLKQGVEEIQQGNLRHIIRIPASDEFGELALAFNQLTHHLEATQCQLSEEHQVLVRQSEHLDRLLNSVDAVIWEENVTQGEFVFASLGAVDLLGYPLADWFAKDFILRHVHKDDMAQLQKSFSSLKQGSTQISVDVRLIHINQQSIWTRIIAGSELDGLTQQLLIRGLIIDITSEKRREEQVVYLAEHDALTGLVNRRYFQERLGHHIAYGQRYGHSAALLFIDLDQFKYINDTYGHLSGDDYLRQVSQRLKTAIRDSDIIGRLGGDEFGVILPVADQEEASIAAGNLLRAMSETTWKHGEQWVHISASIGITVFPGGGQNPSQVLAEADSAMYAAKALGRNRFHVYSESDKDIERMQAKVHVENLIRAALKDERFMLVFQPIIDLQNSNITHYEALIRIVAEADDLILPSEFIDTAERFGLIDEIDKWVLSQVVEVITESLTTDKVKNIAVNLSGTHIDDTHFHAWIKQLLMDSPGVAEHLIIEVTETAAVKNLGTAKEFIDSMKSLGCRFALDDFGVGFSSFHYIKHLPVDYIKIDGSFVRNLHVDTADYVFVQATVDIARSLGIKAIAEFVENEEIVAILRKLGADMGQGFHLGRPDNDFEKINKQGLG